jgi:hypothetical protein
MISGVLIYWMCLLKPGGSAPVAAATVAANLPKISLLPTAAALGFDFAAMPF